MAEETVCDPGASLQLLRQMNMRPEMTSLSGVLREWSCHATADTQATV